MDEKLTASEIFNIIEQIQRNAKDFYQEAASLFAYHSNLFFEMVLLEDSFAQTIAQIKRDYITNSKDTSDPDESLYKSVSGLHVFVGANPSKMFRPGVKKDDIIATAVKIEQSIVKYLTGLANFTSDKKALEALHFIINEKTGEIDTLRNWLNR